MAILVKRSNGFYYSITYVNGRRVWKSTGTSSRSKALLLVERNEVDASKKPEVITLEQFQAPLFNYFNVNLAHSTVLLYKDGFANFRRIVGDLPLTRYTPLMIEEFKITHIKEVSPVKANIEFRTRQIKKSPTWGDIGL